MREYEALQAPENLVCVATAAAADLSTAEVFGIARSSLVADRIPCELCYRTLERYHCTMPSLHTFHYPADRHRRTTVENLKNALKLTSSDKGFIFLSAGLTNARNDTDRELPFRPESNFFYITGVENSGSAVIIDINSLITTLIVQYIDPDTAVWIGTPPSLSNFKEKYSVNNVIYDTEFTNFAQKTIGSSKIYTLPTTDKTLLKNAELPFDIESLSEAIHEARVFKNSEEIAIMRHINHISSSAHDSVMKEASKFKSEREAAALFLYKTSVLGASQLAYETIAAASTRSAILHYIDNNRRIGSTSEYLLLDAGAEFHCYASDITRTYPVGGKFTAQTRNIYEIVLETQKAVIRKIKPGVLWEDLHRYSVKLIGEGLIAIGIIKVDIDIALKNFIPQLFMPHGIGHFLGLDVHDVGGYPKGVERINEPSIRYLRVRRELKVGMVLTVEPGLYFIDELLSEARQNSKIKDMIDWNILDDYKHVGGVRIEDNIHVTESGYDNLTTAIKEIPDIEHAMKA